MCMFGLEGGVPRGGVRDAEGREVLETELLADHRHQVGERVLVAVLEGRETVGADHAVELIVDLALRADCS